MKNINLTLTLPQYKLLLSLLDDVRDTRSNCGCNDVYVDELKMFSVKELKDVLESMGKGYAKEEYKEWKNSDPDGTWEDALESGWGFWDTSFVNYLISIIKKQGKK